MGHDQLFKEFLRAFLPDFLELFWPDAAVRLNFGTLRFLDKELFTDFPEGSQREADVVAQVETVDGEPEILLVHIEVQAERERNFEARMFQYFTLLWLRYRLPVFPIVVYLRGDGGLSRESYRIELLGREVVRFHYDSVSLGSLEAERYVRAGSPVGSALAALMEREDRTAPSLRALILRAIARSGLDEARKFLLLNLVETYFALAPQAAVAFEQLLAQTEYLEEVREMEVTWADKMREEGREQGLRAGLLEGKREDLLALLTLKFGELPPDVVARVKAMGSTSELDACLARILSARSIHDVGLADS